MKIKIEWQDQNSQWHSYQTMNNEKDAFRVAKERSKSTRKRHRLVDEPGNLMDIIDC